jgi:ABC-type antimicrobial peptide transport system permease subunit
MVEPVREALQRVHVDLPALQARTLNDQIAASTFAPRVGAIVLAIFGGVALLLALVGLHAAIAFAVAAGARELGIRVALGAGSADVLARVLHPALRPVFIGSALGALLAGLLGAALRSRLPDLAAVSVLDPAVLAGSGALIGVAALVAAWVPGRRALRLDPVMVLRDG